jgi:hypothetical protein
MWVVVLMGSLLALHLFYRSSKHRRASVGSSHKGSPDMMHAVFFLALASAVPSAPPRRGLVSRM